MTFRRAYSFAYFALIAVLVQTNMQIISTIAFEVFPTYRTIQRQISSLELMRGWYIGPDELVTFTGNIEFLKIWKFKMIDVSCCELIGRNLIL